MVKLNRQLIHSIKGIMEEGNEGWKSRCFETVLKEIFYLEISDATSYKSELRSAAVTCMLLNLLVAGGQPSSSRKNMRTSSGEYHPSSKSFTAHGLLVRPSKLILGPDRGARTTSDRRQVSRADHLLWRLQLADSDRW